MRFALNTRLNYLRAVTKMAITARKVTQIRHTSSMRQTRQTLNPPTANVKSDLSDSLLKSDFWRAGKAAADLSPESAAAAELATGAPSELAAGASAELAAGAPAELTAGASAEGESLGLVSACFPLSTSAIYPEGTEESGFLLDEIGRGALFFCFDASFEDDAFRIEGVSFVVDAF